MPPGNGTINFNSGASLMLSHMEHADVASIDSATSQLIMTSSPAVCSSPVGSVNLCQECPSPDELHCFDLRCFVQPLPVITSQMLEALADDIEYVNETVSNSFNKDNQCPRHARQTEISLINCSKPQSKQNVSNPKSNESMSVSVSPPSIHSEKQNMPFVHSNESYACDHGTCTAPTPLAKKRKLH